MCPPFAGSKLAPCRSAAHRRQQYMRAPISSASSARPFGEHMCSLNSRQAGRTAELPQSHAISEHEASMHTEPRKGVGDLIARARRLHRERLWLFLTIFAVCWLFSAVIASPAFSEREHFRGFRRSAGCKFAAFKSEIRVTVTVSFGAIVAEFALLFRPTLTTAPFGARRRPAADRAGRRDDGSRCDPFPEDHARNRRQRGTARPGCPAGYYTRGAASFASRCENLRNHFARMRASSTNSVSTGLVRPTMSASGVRVTSFF